MKLYEINEMMADFIAKVEAGEVPADAIADTLESLEMAFDEKVDGTVSYIKSLKAEMEAVKAEKDKLAQREKVLKNSIEHTTEYLANQLDGRTFKNGRHVLSWRKSTVVEVAEDFADENYTVTKTEIKVDKTALKKDLQAGKEITGALLVEKQNLQIK